MASLDFETQAAASRLTPYIRFTPNYKKRMGRLTPVPYIYCRTPGTHRLRGPGRG